MKKQFLFATSILLAFSTLVACRNNKNSSSNVELSSSLPEESSVSSDKPSESSIEASSQPLPSSSNTSTSKSSGTSIYDPDESIDPGIITGNKTFKDALNFDYDNYSIHYALSYYDGEAIEEAYEYYVKDITVLLDYTFALDYGQIVYDFYASTNEDDYAYWKKEDHYEYDGWIANGYREADLAMYHAYFDLHHFLEPLTEDDADEILGMYFLNDTGMRKIEDQGIEFYQLVGEDITSIGFLTDEKTGAITKIVGSVSETSDDGFEILISDFGKTTVPQGLTLPKAPYYNSDSDRNIYTYAEMLGDRYVPDVWPEAVSLQVNGNPDTEEGYDAVIDIDESVDISYSLVPNNVNRLEYEWVVSDENVIDLNHKQASGIGHKYATGEIAGEAYVSIKVQIADKTWIESNKLKIKVKELAPLDKTNAVYDLEITGSTLDYTENSDGTRTYNKNKTLVSAYNYVDTDAQFDITGHNVTALEAKNTDSMGDSGMVLSVSPASQEYMNDGFYSEVVFDFGDQEVVSMAFYYALHRSNQRGAAISYLKTAYIATSSDGETWSSPISLKEEFVNNFENINLNYGSNKKIMKRTFTKASKVKLYFEASMVGAVYNIVMNNFVFQNDSTCHNHGASAIDVTSVSIQSTATTCKINETIQFSVQKILPEDATNKRVTWYSSNPAVASVAVTGLVTGISEGTANIYALSNNGVKSNEIAITVVGQEYLPENLVGRKYFVDDENFYERNVDDVMFVITNNTTLTLTTYKSDSTTENLALTYYTKDESVNPTYTFKNGSVNMDVTFHDNSYSNKRICDVTLTGYSLYTIGNSSGGFNFTEYVAANQIQVKLAGNAIDSLTLKVNEKVNVLAIVSPTNAREQEVSAKSNNTSIVTVRNGEYSGFDITAVAPGSTSITFTTANGVNKTITVTVSNPIRVTDFTVNASSSTISTGEIATLTVNLTPSNADTYNFTFSTESTGFVQITKNANGTSASVKGLKAGSVSILVKDTVSGISKNVNLTITASSATISSDYVGTWVGYDDYSQEFRFIIEANGNATLVIYDWDGEESARYSFVNVTPTHGDTYEFACTLNEDTVVGMYNEQFTLYDDACFINDGITFCVYSTVYMEKA